MLHPCIPRIGGATDIVNRPFSTTGLHYGLQPEAPIAMMACMRFTLL